jgi:nucleolar protein 16
MDLLIIELLEIAAKPSIPNVRHTTEVEGHWIQKLVHTYGEDYERMMWDKELNPMQHTPAQLKRKIKRWRETQNK